jgi:hypothetical protein
MLEKQTKKKVNFICTDNGTKFCSNESNDYHNDEGIVRHHTIPCTHQHNGVAECMNKTIIFKARCMLSNAGMSKRFWADAASTAYYLIYMPHF